MYILRCVPQDSTGVSPFELMFGRKPRTTLSLVKENILKYNNEEESVNILKHLKDLKSKFQHLYEFSHNNLIHSQDKMKHLFDKKAKLREFHPGDQVLMYYPIPGAPLREKYLGPYEVLKRTSKVKYVISTPDRRRPTQLVHVNLLKPYLAPHHTVSNITSVPKPDDNKQITPNYGDDANAILNPSHCLSNLGENYLKLCLGKIALTVRFCQI